MGKNDTKGIGEEDDSRAEEASKNLKRDLFSLKRNFRTIHGKFCKIINENKIALIQGKDIEHLKQGVEGLEQLHEEAEAALQAYSDVMMELEMFEDINTEEEKLEVTKGEAQEVRIKIYTAIAKQEKGDGATDLPGVPEDISRQTSTSVPNPSASPDEATEEILVEDNPREEDGRNCTNQATLNASATEFKPCSDVSAISALIETATLCKPEPIVFDGDPLAYAAWRISFDTLIECIVKDQRKLLYYLYKYTKGEVQELVNAYISTDAVGAYKDARAALEERYGNMHVIAGTLKKQLESWPAIRGGDALALHKFEDFLKKCEVKMSTHGLKGLDDSDKILSLLKKL